MDQPLLESQDVAIFLFLIHCLRGDLWKLEKGLLVSLLKYHAFIIIILFKINVRRASLIDDTLDVLAIGFADVR